MAEKGLLFDVVEFCLHDGPGIRTTVFFKGCPLRCEWCHNPEGQSFRPELMVRTDRCAHCGRCARACPTPGACTACGRCVPACPQRLRKVCGFEADAGELAERLMRDRDVFASSGGGVTLSGGEALSQPAFLLDLLDHLRPLHVALDTSGYGARETFDAAIGRCALVLFDIKLTDPAKHLQYTGVDNRLILQNLASLRESGVPFIVRVPLIPGVNDDALFAEQVCGLVEGAKNLVQIDLLPYHKGAKSKYPMLGRTYRISFDPDAAPRTHQEIYAAHGIRSVAQ